jgi:O-antigen/teichoic acid export membrane protein
VRRSLFRVARDRLARNVGWMFAGQMAKLALQAAYFVIAARSLGAHEFGKVAAILAVAALLGMFGGWGSGSVLLMNVARNPSVLPAYWGNVLLITVVAAVPLLGIGLALGALLLPATALTTVGLFLLAEVVFARIVDAAAQAYQALERLAKSACFVVLSPLARVIGALGFVLSSSPRTAAGWSIWYAGALAGSAAVAVVAVSVFLTRPRPDLRHLRRHLRLGFYFSIGSAATSIYADMDKSLLARLATGDAAGIYAAAYRLVSTLFTPLIALFMATYPRFFKRGESGLRSTLAFARSLLPAVVAYGGFASLLLLVAAPAGGFLLGSGYRDSVGAVRWLALLPLVQALGYLGGDVLSGAGFQGMRSGIQAAVAVLNVGLNLWLIPAYSWRGAAVATIVSYVALAALLWSAAWLLSRPRFVPVVSR